MVIKNKVWVKKGIIQSIYRLSILVIPGEIYILFICP